MFETALGYEAGDFKLQQKTDAKTHATAPFKKINNM
jgi:hypothetical protein